MFVLTITFFRVLSTLLRVCLRVCVVFFITIFAVASIELAEKSNKHQGHQDLDVGVETVAPMCHSLALLRSRPNANERARTRRERDGNKTADRFLKHSFAREHISTLWG